MQRGRIDLAVHPQPGGLGLGPGRARLARRLGLRAGQAHLAGRLRLGPYAVGRGLLLGLAAGVGAALVDQLLLAPGQFDLAGQLVLGDGAFPLDGHGPPLVGGPVRFLLDLLAGRGAQGALDLGLGADRDDAHGHHVDAGGRQAGLGGEAGGDPFAHGGDAVDQGRRERGAGQHVQRVLLRGLGEEGGDLFERCAAPASGVRVHGEVEPVRRLGRIADPVRDGGLHGDVLEVGRTGVERHGQLPVVDRHFGERRRQ